MSENTITASTISDLEAKHGKVLHVRREGYEAVFRRPDRMEWRKFMSEIADDDTKPLAAEQLALATCVLPDREGFNRMLDEMPALAQSFGNAVTVFAGLGKAEVIKK